MSGPERLTERLLRFATPKSQRLIDAACRGIVADAYRNVPLFRRRLDAVGVSPTAIRVAGDLSLIPPSERRDILGARRADSLRRGVNPSACRTCGTSGTTGAPLTIYMSRSEALYRKVLLFRAIARSARLSLPFTIAEVGTGIIRLGSYRGDLAQGLRLVRVTKILRTLPVEEQVRCLIRAAPQVVQGHPSCLGLVAGALQASESVGRITPRLVVARGEILRPHVRSLLQTAFRCPVVDHFNCEEVGNVAWECLHQPGVMHINTAGCVVETVDMRNRAVGFGNEGNVVITNLFNRTMPFIRYKLGDRAALLPPSRCACGHNGASMSLVAGRAGDLLKLPSGGHVSPRTVDSVIANAAQCEGDRRLYDLQRYQVRQDAAGHVNVLVVPHDACTSDLDERIARALHELDPRMRVSVTYVPEIPAEASGKLRIVRSDACDSSPE
ncbi:phenylacetate--CoA ligase family protein [Candidatus Bipolaricaulota bacterium]